MSTVEAYLNKLIRTLDNVVIKIVDEVAKVVQTHAKRSRVFKGHVLRDAINIHKSGKFSRIVSADKDYAGFVEYGNNQRGAWIYPVRAKALHFRINGKEIFAKRVRSHGPLKFLEPAGKHGEKKAKSIMTKHLNRWIKS